MRKVVPSKADQPLVRTDPEIAIRRLGDAVDCSSGKTASHAPGVLEVLRCSLLWDRERRPRETCRAAREG